MGLIKTNDIPISVKRECIRLHRAGLTSREIYDQYYSRDYDTAYSGFMSMLKVWKKKVDIDTELLEAGNLGYRFTPHATTVQLDSNGEIVQSWIKSSTGDNLYMELIEAIGNLPVLERFETRPTDTGHDMLEIPLFDMHFREANKERYESVQAELDALLMERTYTEVNIVIGQDLFHNDDFRGRTSSGREIERVDMIASWNEARKFYYHLIETALTQSQKVKVIFTKGNHDESMAWAFVQMIKAQFDGSIEVDDSYRERKLITYGTNFIGLTHGDKARNKPIDLRSMFTIEYPIEYAHAKVREIHAGHLHHERGEDVYGIMCRRLSTANAQDDYHNDNGYVGAHKRFTVFRWNPEKLVAIYYV